MRKVVSLYLPTWPADRHRRQLQNAAPPPTEPLVLAGRQGASRIVLAADAAAQRLGLQIGLTLAEAQARVPALHVHDADPVADQAALERLALWCFRQVSPVVALDPPDGLWLDITGVGHLFGGDRPMLTNLVARLKRAGIMARVAMATTTGAAHALARYGYEEVALAGRQIQAGLGVLPIAALRLPPDMVLALRKLGFEQISHLERTARAPLALRFGPLISQRLDQLFGRVPEPLDAVEPDDLLQVEQAFGEPISAPEILQRYIAMLAGSLCTVLRHRALGARCLDLLFHRVDATIASIRIGTAVASQDAQHLARLLSDRLETVDPGFGVERMSLAAPGVEPIRLRQASTLNGHNVRDIAGLVDLLANRFGQRRLYRIVPVESDVPERATRRVAALAPAGGASWPIDLPRPSRLLTRPEPVDTLALLPDHPPVQFTWRGVRRKVVRADGPERVYGEWWCAPQEWSAVRDYFQVEDQAGERFWLFRSGDGEDPATGTMRWYLHGLFA